MFSIFKYKKNTNLIWVFDREFKISYSEIDNYLMNQTILKKTIKRKISNWW